MRNRVFSVLKYTVVILGAQYAIFFVASTILKKQKPNRAMSVVDKLNKRKENENER